VSVLEPILEELHPNLFQTYEVVRSIAGVRALPKRNNLGSLPLADRIGDINGTRLWVLTGLGSRGLLYHSWLSDKLAHAMLLDDLESIPVEVRRLRTDVPEDTTTDSGNPQDKEIDIGQAPSKPKNRAMKTERQQRRQQQEEPQVRIDDENEQVEEFGQ